MSSIFFSLASLAINGASKQNVTNFAPVVTNGYSISPNNSKIRLTNSGHLITDVLDPQDSGTYTFTSPDHGGASVSINVTVYGKDRTKC